MEGVICRKVFTFDSVQWTRWGQSAWELAVSRDRRGESRRLSDRRAFGSRVVMALIMYVSEMHNSCIKEDKQGINYRMHTNISFLKIHSLETEK